MTQATANLDLLVDEYAATEQAPDLMTNYCHGGGGGTT